MIEIQKNRKQGIEYKIKYYKAGNIISEKELIKNISDSTTIVNITDLIEFNPLSSENINILDDKYLVKHLIPKK